ncbi:MAG: PAS domain S-box protein [Cyanobacteria bacterium SZAS TMP-1]|nr:PAS domain S-box protein [Cyanobacteria bacterium SZAS TMP-1]
MRMHLTISQKGLLIFCIILVAELLFAGLYWNMAQSADAQIAEEKRVRQIISHLTNISNHIQDASVGLLKTLVAPGDVPGYVSPLQAIPGELSKLRGLVQSKEELDAIQRLAKTTDAGFPVIESARATYRAKDHVHQMVHLRYLLQLIELSHSATGQVTEIQEYFRAMQDANLAKQAEDKDNAKKLLLFGLALNVVLVGGIVTLFIRDITARLRVLTDNSIRVAAGLPLNRPLTGPDEITRVDKSFHTMANLLHESQRREKAVIDNALDVICSINGDGRFVEVSPACQTAWGYAPVELIGRRYVELLERSGKGEDNEKLFDLIKDASKSSFENRIMRKDGAAVDTLWSAQWSAEENSWFCVAHDITDRKKAEQLKRDFVAMVSHDLRTPLASVELSLKLLTGGACGVLPVKAVENITEAQHNLAFVMILINGLLEFERMNAGKLRLRLAEINMADVLTRSLEAIQPLAERDGVTVTADHPDIDFIGDENRLIQVVVNLLSNALKFAPKGSTIKVTTVASSSSRELTVKVKDNGPGIPAAEQTRIFQRFERIEQANSADGAGLGLAICKAIVEQHGGTIGVESVEGQGSTFYFTVPKEPPTYSASSNL